jgi:hypothetical protein
MWEILEDCKSRRGYVLARCVCGKLKEVNKPSIISGRSSSCGCLGLCHLNRGYIRFSKSKEPLQKKAYTCWVNIRQRCNNPRTPGYKKYGARGIVVSHEWNTSFEKFLLDMGVPPSLSHSIDRIDGALGYCKENCRWATARQQTLNKRCNLILEIDGDSKMLIEWVEIAGTKLSLAYNRIKRGWSPKEAVFTPRKTTWSRHRKRIL